MRRKRTRQQQQQYQQPKTHWLRKVFLLLVVAALIGIGVKIYQKKKEGKEVTVKDVIPLPDKTIDDIDKFVNGSPSGSETKYEQFDKLDRSTKAVIVVGVLLALAALVIGGFVLRKKLTGEGTKTTEEQQLKAFIDKYKDETRMDRTNFYFPYDKKTTADLVKEKMSLLLSYKRLTGEDTSVMTPKEKEIHDQEVLETASDLYLLFEEYNKRLGEHSLLNKNGSEVLKLFKNVTGKINTITEEARSLENTVANNTRKAELVAQLKELGEQEQLLRSLARDKGIENPDKA